MRFSRRHRAPRLFRRVAPPGEAQIGDGPGKAEATAEAGILGQHVQQDQVGAERARVLLRGRQLRLAGRGEVERQEDAFERHRATL